mmetsp:Transcript_1621/g.1764  ORF Transcript_1621/g.1764 Transcript_1621/m.1764 type:complete len:80 (-) Transcript_1621:796-1035(-)
MLYYTFSSVWLWSTVCAVPSIPPLLLSDDAEEERENKEDVKPLSGEVQVDSKASSVPDMGVEGGECSLFLIGVERVGRD